MRQYVAAEQLDLPAPVVAPELEQDVIAARVAVLLDRRDAVGRGAGDRLAAVEQVVAHHLGRGLAPAAVERLRDRPDLLRVDAGLLEQYVGGARDVLDLVREVHRGDLARAGAAAVAVLVDRGDDDAAEVETRRVTAGVVG